MDTENGRLVREEFLRQLSEEEQRKFVPVPEELQEEAEAALVGQDETVIDLKVPSPLSDWANKHNAKARNRKANKRARRSRRANRK